MKFNLETIKNSFVSVTSQMSFAVKKKAPEICLGVGIVSIGAGVVLACKATRKVDTITNEFLEFSEKCEEGIGQTCSDGTIYSEEDYETDVTNEKIKSYVYKAKAYFPACLLIAAGMGSIIFGQKILKDRYTAAVTAANLIGAAYNSYRMRVADAFGDDVEKAIYLGKPMTVGEDIQNLEVIMPKEPDTPASPFTYVFDESNPYFTNSNYENAAFLKKTMATLNVILRTKRHLFLGDVLEEIGDSDYIFADPVLAKAARNAGWIDGYGEDYVDFGYICEDFVKRAADHEFDDMEPIAVVLDFNALPDIINDISYKYKKKD